MNRTRAVVILIVGETRQPEWQEFPGRFSWPCQVIQVTTLKQAADLVRNEYLFPDLIFLLQIRGHQFSFADWVEFHRASPLSLGILIFDSWCEGDSRSGAPLPGLIRIHRLRWEAVAEALLERFARRKGPSPWLPPTAADDERVLAESGRPAVRKWAKTLLVCSGSDVGIAWLAAVVAPFAERVQRGVLGAMLGTPLPDGIILDAQAEIGEVEADLRAWRRTFGQVGRLLSPCIVLANFPRKEEVNRLRSLGASFVLPKPVVVADLEWCLARLAPAEHQDMVVTRPEDAKLVP